MNGTRDTADETYDVIVLGSGIAGSVLGAILAKNGAKVALVDAGVHPRFAVGESTTLYTLNVFRILARRYGVPEIEAFCSTAACEEKIGSSFGTKRNFGFMLHRDGEEPDPREVNQFAPPSAQLQTSHLHRQDSDSYLFHVAIHYGCDQYQAFRVVDVHLDEDDVTVIGATGQRIKGRYLVDGSGFRSPIANKRGLRAAPDALSHHSRSMFTHMLDVRTTDSCLLMEEADRPPIPWVQGTMHHLIDRGWFWIIPFNNHASSRNPLISIGLTIDERLYPKPEDLTPEQEFRQHVARYPALERIFADAKTVRPWVSTGRLQYTSTQTVGHRWCLMSHAAGFIDPLYSRGLTNTGEVINSLAWRLLAALRDDDFSDERFTYIDDLQKGLIKYNDELVHASFVSFSNYELWNSVYRVWGAAEVPINLRFGHYLDEFMRTGDDQVLVDMEDVPFLGHLLPDNPDYAALFDTMVDLVNGVEKGARDATATGRELMDRIRRSPAVLPYLGLDDRDARFIYPDMDDLTRMVRWLGAEGPEHMRYMAHRPRYAAAMTG